MLKLKYHFHHLEDFSEDSLYKKLMNYRITILLIIALLSVSTSPISAKTLTGVPAVSISFWRMFIGSFLLWIYSVFYKQGTVKENKNYSKTMLAGILLGLHFSLFFEWGVGG